MTETQGANEHGKGIINTMSSFGVKNNLRMDIITNDIYFDKVKNFKSMCTLKSAKFYYARIEPDLLNWKRYKYI